MRTMIRKRKLLNNDIVQEKKKRDAHSLWWYSHNNIIDFSILISSINLFGNEKTSQVYTISCNMCEGGRLHKNENKNKHSIGLT